MSRKKTGASERRSGMTLLEIILAIAISGSILFAATAYVVSISNIWADREERHFFEDHVDGVTEFLKSAFLSAGHELSLNENPTNPEEGTNPQENNPPSPNRAQPNNNPNKNTENSDSEKNSGSSLMTQSRTPITWEKPPGWARYKDPILHFSLAEDAPLLVGLDSVPATKVEVYLHFDEEYGLELIWYSNLQEEAKDTQDLQRTPLSPHVSAIRYLYWDESFEQWEEEEEPRKGEGQADFILPTFLKLVFTYKEEEKTRLLPLPVTLDSALLF
ncbi:MAG: type II secretion system protein [Coraliomargaritaceae bacterium]